jgi:hypothetical protein
VVSPPPNMPTPDDAMLSPPAEHDSILPGRVTCPPEESRLHRPHDSTSQQPLHADNDDGTPFTRPTQQPTPPLGDRDTHSDVASPTNTHTKNLDQEMDGPVRDIPTPLSVQDDATEEQRNSSASQLPAATPAPASWSQSSLYSSPFPTHRVRITVGDEDGSMRDRNSTDLSATHSFYRIRPPRACGPAVDSRATRNQTVSSMKLKLRSSMWI